VKPVSTLSGFSNYSGFWQESIEWEGAQGVANARTRYFILFQLGSFQDIGLLRRVRALLT
jgi:hypothetical protein